MSVPFSTKCRLFRKLMSLGSQNIYIFLKKHATNLNAHSEKLDKLGLTAGI
jgi:hypothetical protein